MKKITYLLYFIVISIWSQDQHEPQNWQKLTSRYANIIYKLGQKKEANTIANTIDYIQQNSYKSMSIMPNKRIDVILRANTIVPNGFVTISPFRSEFFNTAPSSFNNVGTTDWMSTLAIHEYRHVQQFLNHKTGATNFLYWLLGETGWAIGSLLTIPNWYFEGDAVVMETALTKSGRGRLPKFTALQRALFRNSIFYSYQKIRNGSYKDLTPNHYETGYQMLNYYRNHFNASRLDNIAKNAAAYQFPFYAFSTQMKRETGLTTKKLYQKTLKANTLLWQKNRDSLQVKTYTQITSSTNKITEYHFPQLLENGNIIALKSSADEISSFYGIDSLREATKITPAIFSVDRYFHYHKHQLVFTGLSYHPRYNFTSYSNIHLYDVKQRKLKKITSKKRYFSPAFNHNNTKIITIENNQNNSKIVVLDLEGKELKKIDIEGFITRPKFIDNHHYVYIKQQNHRVAIFKIDNNKFAETQITPWTSHSIDNINIYQNKVYYSASFSGIDNIYESSLDGGLVIKQVTNASIGAYQPYVTNNRLYFIEPTTNGNKVSETTIEPTPFKFKEPVLMNFNNQKTVVFEGGNVLDKVEHNHHVTIPYQGIFKDLKFHDWNFGFSSRSVFEANVTATTLLNDFSLLGNTAIYLNENNSYGLSATGSFKKWFPVLNLSLNYQHRDFKTNVSDINNNIFEASHIFDDVSIRPSITLPLSQLAGNYSNIFAFHVGYEHHKIFNPVYKIHQTGQEITFDNNENNFFSTRLKASSKRRTALQHINPKAGFATDTRYKKGVANSNGYYLYSNHSLFLPGLLKTHNSYVNIAYQKNNINVEDVFVYARGYQNNKSVKVSKIAFNYQLPLFYPDVGLLDIAYLKRIRATFFGDFSNLTTFNNQKTKQHSIGFETIFDTSFFNIGDAEIGLGYRGSYLLKKDIFAPENKFVSSFFIAADLF